jgi:hypothetical protein
MAAQTAEQIQTQLDQVRAAITSALAAQSYSVANRSVSRAALSELTKREKELMRRLARVGGSGPLVLSETAQEEII